jgi:hypothetical protein
VPLVLLAGVAAVSGGSVQMATGVEHTVEFPVVLRTLPACPWHTNQATTQQEFCRAVAWGCCCGYRSHR